MTLTALSDPLDGFGLERFVEAQERDYPRALEEIRNGRKQTHWMWYLFPQFEGLGFSSVSQYYAVKSAAEARAFLAHPILGPRLIECAEAVVGLDGLSAAEIFGFPDNMKLRSSATLFASVSHSGSVFHRILDKYFDGQWDVRTLRLMGATA
jgi:uncharacterized protein (DUF1810 family)